MQLRLGKRSQLKAMFAIACCFILLVGARARECSTTDFLTDTYKVYYGWPFAYTCVSLTANDEFYYEYGDDFYDDESSDFTCVITDLTSEKVVLNSTLGGDIYSEFPNDEIRFTIDNITQNTPKVYETRLQKLTTCWIHRITLEPLYLPIESCEENLRRTTAINNENALGMAFKGRCDVPGDAIDVPRKLVDKLDEATKLYWVYNCQEKLPENTNIDPDDNSLIFTNISYETNPGVYTCVVEHNGMTRYRVHQKMCVKPRVSISMSIKCSDHVVRTGDDVEVECVVDAGLGVDSMFGFSSRFNKLNSTGQIDFTRENSSCVAYANHNSLGLDERIFCKMSITLKKLCFSQTPTKEELETQKTFLVMVYRIKNVTKSDYGVFRASISRASHTETTTFSLIYDRQPGLEKSNRLLVICLVAIGATAIICLILWIVCEIELRWIWLKLCKPTEKGLKKYVAYLAYYYDKEMYKTPPAQLEAFVMNLNTRLKSKGGEVFDRCRDPGTDQYNARNISSKLSECHRVVIILTPEYVDDHWSVYEAYEALKSVIENGSKIIFITFPNTMSAIKDLPQNSRIALKKALKRHKLIEWDGTMPFPRRMRIQLELFMPKLEPQTGVEMVPTNVEENGVTRVKQNGHGPDNHGRDTNQNIYENNV